MGGRSISYCTKSPARLVGTRWLRRSLSRCPDRTVAVKQSDTCGEAIPSALPASGPVGRSSDHLASLRDGLRRHLGLRPTYEPAATKDGSPVGPVLYANRDLPDRIDPRQMRAGGQNGQLPGLGSSMRGAVPGGTLRKVATKVAVVVPSLRTMCTSPPWSQNPCPAAKRCGVHAGSSPR